MAIDDQRGVAPMASSDHLSTLNAHNVQCAHHPGDHELRMDRRGRLKKLTEGERGAITTARLAYSTHTHRAPDPYIVWRQGMTKHDSVRGERFGSFGHHTRKTVDDHQVVR